MDFKDNAIILDTAAAPEPTAAPIPTAKNNLEPLPEVEVETVDGKEYVRKSNILKMLDSLGITNYDFSSTSFYNKDDMRKGIILLKNIPHHPTNNELIPVDYYTKTVIPAINNLR